MVLTASSTIGRISALGMRARARIESVWMVADARRASARGSAPAGNSPVARASANNRPNARSVESIASATRARISGSATASEDVVSTVKQPRGPSSPLR